MARLPGDVSDAVRPRITHEPCSGTWLGPAGAF